MSKRATILPPQPDGAQTVEKRFKELADRWREDVLLLSSMTQMVQHPAYQEIIALGRT